MIVRRKECLQDILNQEQATYTIKENIHYKHLMSDLILFISLIFILWFRLFLLLHFCKKVISFVEVFDIFLQCCELFEFFLICEIGG